MIGLRTLLGAALGGMVAFSAMAEDAYQWDSLQIGGGGFVDGILYHPSEHGLLYARTDVGGAFRWDNTYKQWISLAKGLDHDHSELMGVLSVAVDPHDANRVYLASGLYTQEWAKKGAVLISTDRGESWTRSDLPFRLGGNEDGRSMGERLAVDPNLGSTLFLGSSRDGLWKSEDGAVSWHRVDAFPAQRLAWVLFDPSGEAGKATPTLYAGTLPEAGQAALYRSKDAGRSWQALPGQPAGLIAHHAALDDAGSLYVTYADGLGPNGITKGAVYRLDTKTGAWTDISPAHPEGGDTFGFAGLAVDPRASGTLLVSTLDRWGKGDDIFRSTDGGAHWQGLEAASRFDDVKSSWLPVFRRGAEGHAGHWIGTIAINPFNSADAISGTGYGLWRTVTLTQADKGGQVTWYFTDRGLEETATLALANPPAGPHLLAALGDVGGFSFTDPHRPGQFFDPAGGSNSSIDFAERHPERIVRTIDKGASRGYLSTDAGKSWTPFATQPPTVAEGGPSGMLAISADGARIVWAPPHSVPYVSDDDGKSWKASAGRFDPAHRLIVLADRADRNAFTVQDVESEPSQFYRSTDGGKSFETVATLNRWGGTPVAVPGCEGCLLVPSAWNGLQYSTDGGHSFKPVKGFAQAWVAGVGAPAPGESNPSWYVYGSGGKDEGLYLSTDNGRHWQRIDDDSLRPPGISALAGDRQVFGRVFIAAGGRGIAYAETVPAK